MMLGLNCDKTYKKEKTKRTSLRGGYMKQSSRRMDPGLNSDRLATVISIILIFSLLGARGVFAADQQNESTGPGGYGWQQAYSKNATGGWAHARMTASADRDFYDYGYKPIEVFVRLETYWSQDCGWWYITGGKAIDVVLSNGTNTFLSNTTAATSVASKGVRNLTYSWSSFSTAAPGRWNVTADDNGNHTLSFYIYVRGQLNVTSIANDSNSEDSPIQIDATLKDHTGRAINGTFKDNAGNDAFPTVTLYVTGAGEDFTQSMTDSDGDGVWTASFTPANPGDHKIVVKASDDHQYWIDGRGSTVISVTGQFPYASLVIPALSNFFGDFGEAGLRAVAAILAGLGGIFTAIRWRRNG
jgi:hypothetical protein